jgi:predicted PurR-regulated permease PerM
LAEPDYKKYVFYAILILIAYFFYLLISPFATYLALGIALSIVGAPLYFWVMKKTNNKKLSALIVIAVIILIIIIPTYLILSSLVSESISFFANIDLSTFNQVFSHFSSFTGTDARIDDYISKFLVSAGEYMMGWTLNFIGSVSEAAIGLLIMFTLIYYALVDGEVWLDKLKSFMPFSEVQRELLLEKIKAVTKSVLYGEVLIAVVQGILGGTAFFILNIPNPVFWGFMMAVLAFLPILGTGMVWAPAGIFKIATGEPAAGIMLLIYGIIVISGMDYALRPKIISKGGSIHPMTALIGAFGGIKFLGFPGLILGPLVAAILEAVVHFHYEDYLSGKKGKKK